MYIFTFFQTQFTTEAIDKIGNQSVVTEISHGFDSIIDTIWLFIIFISVVYIFFGGYNCT